MIKIWHDDIPMEYPIAYHFTFHTIKGGKGSFGLIEKGEIPGEMMTVVTGEFMRV